jgi:hypothetical protein
MGSAARVWARTVICSHGPGRNQQSEQPQLPPTVSQRQSAAAASPPGTSHTLYSSPPYHRRPFLPPPYTAFPRPVAGPVAREIVTLLPRIHICTDCSINTHLRFSNVHFWLPRILQGVLLRFVFLQYTPGLHARPTPCRLLDPDVLRGELVRSESLCRHSFPLRMY